MKILAPNWHFFNFCLKSFLCIIAYHLKDFIILDILVEKIVKNVYLVFMSSITKMIS